MLENLHIQNFRLFKEFHIKNLAHVNLVVGKNNVGKSTLLEAINLLVKQYQPNVFLEAFRAVMELRGETSNYNRHYQLRHLFPDHEFPPADPIFIKSNGSQNLSLKIQLAPDKNALRIVPSTTEEFLVEKVTQTGDLEEKVSTIYPPSPNEVKSQYITTQGLDRKQMRWLWDQIQLTPKESDVDEALRILEPTEERVAFRADSSAIIKLRGKSPVPLGSMGDGINRILGIAIALANSGEGYLLIDEIDTGLHYRTITDMWRLVMETAVRLNVQVFATTHSWDCVRSFAEALEMQDNKEVGALFRLERRNEEEIAAVRYGADDLSFIVSQDIQNLEVR